MPDDLSSTPPPSRPAAFYRRVADGALLAALLAVPLYFTVFTERIFEPEKAALLRSIALIAAAGLVGSAVVSGRRPRLHALVRHPLARHPLAVAAAAIWLTDVIATTFSVAPWTSLIGSYSRGQGLATGTALAVLFVAAARIAAREGGAARLAAVIGATVFPAGLYGVIQSYGLDPLPWEGDVVTRVVGPAGASVMLGAHLIVALPFAIWMAVRAWSMARDVPSASTTVRLAAWLATVSVGLWVLLLSGGRGPLLGLTAGAAVATLAWLAVAGRRRAALGIGVIGMLAIVGLIELNVAVRRGGPDAIGALARLPMLGRLSLALDPDNSTTRVRLRLWLGATEMVAASPYRLAVGYGPEAMDLAYAPFYPPILAYDEPRGWVPDRAHNLALDTLIASGGLGLFALLSFFTLLIDTCLQRIGLARTWSERRRWLAFWVGGGAFGLVAGRLIADPLHLFLTGPALPVWMPAHDWVLAGPLLGVGAVVGLIAWLALYAGRGSPDSARHGPGRVPIGFGLAVLAATVAHFVEVQVGFGTTASRLLLFAAAGGMAGLGRMRETTAAAAATDRTPAMPIWPALVVAITLVFDFARPGVVAGGYPVAAAMVLLSALVVGVVVGSAPTTAARTARVMQGWLVGGLALATYTLLHVALVRAGTAGDADAGPAMASTLAWYGIALVGSILVSAWLDSDGRPWRIAGRGSIAAVAAAVTVCAIAIAVLAAPTLADALFKEGRLGWQDSVSGLQRDGQPGKAASFLDRARDRYALAARLAPWEPTYRLALARAAVEAGDLVDARMSRALAEAGLSTAEDEYAPDLLGGRAADLAAERDRWFDLALADIALAESLWVPAPGPALTRARALRVWGDRTRLAGERRARLATARDGYDEAHRLAPRWPEVLDEAAETAILAGDRENALTLTAQAVALDPYYTRAWRTAASAHAELGASAAAAAAYARYFEDYRNASDLPALRGYLESLVGAKRVADALRVARDVTRLAPGDAHAHADLAVLLDQSGDTAAALVEARKAADLDPGDPGIAELVRGLEGAEADGG